MKRPIYDFFTRDHQRVETLLDKACADMHQINHELYHQFRVGLLTHIKMEEKILFKAAQEANDGEPLTIKRQLRMEHGAITTLMVLPPSEDLLIVLKAILSIHDEKEEKPGGMYDLCEKLTLERREELLTAFEQVEDTPVHPYNEADYALEAAKRSLNRAGFDWDEILANNPG